MKHANKSILAIAILAMCSTSFASNNGSGSDNNGGNVDIGNVTATTGPINNSNVAQGGAGGLGGAGGNANATGGTGGAATIGDIRNTNTATGGSVIGSGNSSAAGGSVRDSGNSNSTSAAGAAVVGSGNSTASSGVTGSGNSVTDVSVQFEAQKRDPVATAYSNLAAPSAPCMGSSSMGVQAVGFGVSAGSTWTSDGCNDREDIRAAYNYGDQEVAEQMLVDKIKGYAEAKQKVDARRAQQAKLAPKQPQATQAAPALTAMSAPVQARLQQNRFSDSDVEAAKAKLGL